MYGRRSSGKGLRHEDRDNGPGERRRYSFEAKQINEDRAAEEAAVVVEDETVAEDDFQEVSDAE